MVLAVGPSLPQWLKKIQKTQTLIRIMNEIHSHALFRNKSLSSNLPLTFFSDPVTAPLPWTKKQLADLEANITDETTKRLLTGTSLPPGLHFRKLKEDVVDSIWTWELAYDDEPVFTPSHPNWYIAASLGTLASYWPHHFLEDLSKVEFLKGNQIVVPSSLGVVSGYYTKTVENRPLVCPLNGIPSVYLAGCFSGFGMMAAQAAGELTAMHILKENLPSYAGAFDMNRYTDASYVKNIPNMHSGQL